MPTSDQRLIALETKVSYQEKLLEDLDGVVTEQQSQIDGLERRLERLANQIRTASADEPEVEEPPPPHY